MHRLGQQKLLMTLLAGFGFLALTLATLGIASVAAYTVQQRTTEIGVRVALGARPSHVLRLVAMSGLAPVAAGLAAGCAGVFVLGRLLASQLYGTSALDPVAIGGSVGAPGAIALLASLLPARRALRVDPITTLRGE
ncbi:MAG: FtsX-like permease family protein [Acidobacteria bacterium]|nr:FtsX-like permease family protein [Acidobacteriota bacterium]